jgi:DNA-binding IclR family transcriptional regulator
MARTPPDDDTVLGRATRILEVFGADTPSLSASEIARRAGIPMASAHRMVGDMIRLGLLERGADRLIRVGVRLWELGWRSTAALGVREVAMPYMEDLQAVVKQHTQLAVLDGADVLYIERLSARGRTVVNITRVAGRLPAHTCSSGFVLLAHGPAELREQVLASPLRRFTPKTVTDPAELRRLLADTRQRGFATVNGAVHLDAAGIAAPIHGPARQVVAALSVIVPSTPADIAAAMPVVLATARGISRAVRTAQAWRRDAPPPGARR